MATPIDQKQHIETCSMKHDGEEVTVTGTFELVRVDPEFGGDPYGMPRPIRCTIAHVAQDGARQELAIGGQALAQLRILLDRMYGVHERGLLGGTPLGSAIPKGRR